MASGELVFKMFEAMCYCVFTTTEVCFEGSLFLSYALDMQRVWVGTFATAPIAVNGHHFVLLKALRNANVVIIFN